METVRTNANLYDPKRYSTEEEALKHVEDLRHYGVWPGVVRYRDNRFGLTYSPVRAHYYSNGLPTRPV